MKAVESFACFSLGLVGIILLARFSGAQQQGEIVTAIQPGQQAQGTVHRFGKEWFRLSFPNSGTAVAELSGFPSDCAFQVGSRGFQQSESGPVDWTEGQPGKAVRHTFQVQAGQAGTIWVELRSRVSGVSNADWVGVICSNDGPCYTLPERGKRSGAAPATFDGRPVRPAITFRLVANLESAGASSPSGDIAGAPRSTGGAPPMATTPTTPFRDDLIGFGFDYPEGWIAVGIERGTYRVRGPDDTPAAQAVATIQIVAKKGPRDSALKHLLRIHGELVAGRRAEATKLGPTTVAGEKALFANHIFDALDAGGHVVPFDHVQVVTEYGGNIYLVSFEAPHDLFVKQVPMFKQILNTWRYEKAAR